MVVNKGLSGVSCYISDGDEEITEDTTSLSSGFTFKGNKCELKKIPFNVESDLINVDSDREEFFGECDREEVEKPTHCDYSYRCEGGEDCGDCTPAERNKWYTSYVILAIPPNHKFKLLSKNNGYK